MKPWKQQLILELKEVQFGPTVSKCCFSVINYCCPHFHHKVSFLCEAINTVFSKINCNSPLQVQYLITTVNTFDFIKFNCLFVCLLHEFMIACIKTKLHCHLLTECLNSNMLCCWICFYLTYLYNLYTYKYI